MRFSQIVRSLLAVAALAVSATSAARAAAASPMAREPALTAYSGVAISPDGRYVADVEARQSPDETREVADHLVVREIANGRTRTIPLSCAQLDGCSVTLPAWSHDSRSIAYVVHAPKGKTRDAFVARIGPGPIVADKLLSFTGTLGALRFSRDDTRLAGLAIPNAHKEVGATQAGAAIVGEIGTAPDEQRIAVIPLAHPAVSYASPPDLFVYEYDWMPDGHGFAGTAAHGDGDNNWWIARLYRFDAASGAATEIYHPLSAQLQIASPRVSPSGTTLAFIGGIMSDFGSTGGDLYTLDLRHPDATPVDVTSGTTASVTSVQWLCRSDDLLFSQLRGPNLEIAYASGAAPSTAVVADATPVTDAAGDGVAVSRACESAPGTPGRLAAIRQTFEEAPEIATGTLGGNASVAWKRLTHANDAVPAEASARSLTWTNDGFTVQGWLLEPPRAGAAAKLPLITIVHGGPAAANTPRFVGRGNDRDLLRHGYSLFLPNPRGSFGQGEPFTLANVKDFGYGDLRDILTGVDAAERLDPRIDDARLGITGGSYGGFMTMWAVTQTQRFKAAVAGAGLSNWISYYGENGIDEWMIPYFGASAYDDPAVYRKSSPIDFIKNVKTPTFAFVGERDVECPAPQSLEFWHALSTENVPTSLVIYPGEGHRIRDPRHTADVKKRTIAWFDRYLGAP